MHDSEIPSPRELVRHAYSRLEAERDQLFRIAVIPVLLQFIVLALLHLRERGLSTLLLAAALTLVAFTLFDVAWLRRLLGADAHDPPLTYRWTARHTGFVGRLLLIYLILMVVALPVALIAAMLPENLGLMLQAISAPLFFYVSLRLSPFMVARTVDGPCNLRQSWEGTRDGIWRFFWGAAFAVLPLTILVIMVREMMIAAGIAARLPLVMTLITTAAAFVIRALLLIVIARVYEVRMMQPVRS